MPPRISDHDEKGFSKPLTVTHSGSDKFNHGDQQIYQPHVFQQSVTLTATMWNENESKERWDTWKIGNVGILAEYSPLFLGLICGFGIVLVATTSLMLWKYCTLTASKLVCCRKNYGMMTCQLAKNNFPKSFGKKESSNIFESINKIEVHPVKKNFALQRSVTVDSIPLNATTISDKIHLENKLAKYRDEDYQARQSLQFYAERFQTEPLKYPDLYTSHLYLHKIFSDVDLSKNISRSTPAIEDLYTKVNFSKKRKNRMGNGDAAVIAMSKSHSGNGNSAIDELCSAIIVYNERTAL